MIKNAVSLACSLVFSASASSVHAENMEANSSLLTKQAALPAELFDKSLRTHAGIVNQPPSVTFEKFAIVAQLSLSKTLNRQHTQEAINTTESAENHISAINQAQILMANGEADSAYALLLPLEDNLAGDLQYDRLLAQVALSNCHPNVAIMALERAAAIHPSELKTRSLLAQAYYELGELEASKAEFEVLLKNNTSKQDAEAINKFIGAIDRQLKGGSTISAYFETGLGWDSNINSATNDPTTAYSIPGFTFDDLATTAGEVSSSFLQLTGGLIFSVPITEQFSYIGNVKLNKTLNQRFKEFEIASVDLSAGVQYKHGKNALSINLQNNHFYVDDDYFREATGLLGQWQHTMNAQQQFSIYSMYSKLDFEDFDDRKADRYLVGANYVQAFSMKYSPILFGSIYVAKEDAQEDTWSHDIYGFRAGGQLKFTPKWTFYSTLGYENREYDGVDLVFNAIREDQQYDVSLGLNYTPAPLWTIKPKISYIKNDANILLYEYDRSLFAINIQRDFNW